MKTYFSENSLKRIGILGNRVAMQTHLFGMIDNVNFIIPDAETLNKVGEAYMKMAKRGRCDDHERQLLIIAGQNMIDQNGADAILLGGTDLFLAFDGKAVSYPIIDAAQVHVADLIKATQ